MKKLIITCALLTFGTVVSFAQSAVQPAQTSATMSAGPQARPGGMPKLTPEQRAERRAKSVTSQLGLTQDQYKQIYTANLDMIKKVDELRASGKQPQRADFEAVSATFDEKMSKILTPDQYQKYKGMMNHQHPAGAPSAAPGIPAPTMSK